MHTSIRFSCSLSLLLLALLSTAACSPLASPASAQPLKPSDDSAPLVPIGRFSAISLPRLLVLSIHNDSHFEVYLDNERVDSGSFAIAGSQVKIDSLECEKGGDGPAIYHWLYEEGELTFQASGPDTCSERRQYLAGPFEPQYLFIYEPPAYASIKG